MNEYANYRWWMLVATFLLAPSAQALELRWQGFAVQTALHTEGNSSFGESDTPSLDFYEAGLFATAQLTPRLLASAQVFVAEAGSADDGSVRLDYALLDWQVWSKPAGTFGLRAGRVKNPFGLHNDTRDVIFLRPGILLPQAVYLERTGIRDVLVSADGIQLYGSVAHRGGVTALELGVAVDREADKKFRRNLSGGGLTVRQLDIVDFRVAQLLTDWSRPSLRTGLSYLTAGLDAQVDGLGAADLVADIWALSLQWDRARATVTAEYSVLTTTIRGIPGEGRSRSDGVYIQYERFLPADLSLFARYDLDFADRNDRDGRRHAAATGEPRHSQFARNLTLGGSWRPSSNWGLWAEVHLIDGTHGADRNADRHWEMFLVSAAIRF